MEVETRHIQVFERLGLIEHVEAAKRTIVKSTSNFSAGAILEQFRQVLMAKSLYHYFSVMLYITCVNRCVTRHQIANPGSVAERAIDEAKQRLAGVEPSEILCKQLARLIHVISRCARHVRRQDHILDAPQRAGRIERLLLEDVQPCSAQS